MSDSREEQQEKDDMTAWNNVLMAQNVGSGRRSKATRFKIRRIVKQDVL